MITGALWSSFVLAGPGVLIGAASVALFVKFAFPYQWSWELCMVLCYD